MTKVSFYRNDNGHIIAFEVKGHAQAGEKGYDIVCAAISALAQTAVLGLVKHAKAKVDYSIKSGFLKCQLKQETNEKTDAILETLLLGLIEIQGVYKENLKIEYFGGESHV